ncbi:unnamed protein product [Protopolystoma xenopodis]|uniref:Uncharacterized protein n=1 Tax=Protopolystoma xenopodis TaxID=117903 RepID=A0A448XKI4_9PLAT|nr:unnamed protein product [Protopolystoma xenopodis]
MKPFIQDVTVCNRATLMKCPTQNAHHIWSVVANCCAYEGGWTSLPVCSVCRISSSISILTAKSVNRSGTAKLYVFCPTTRLETPRADTTLSPSDCTTHQTSSKTDAVDSIMVELSWSVGKTKADWALSMPRRELNPFSRHHIISTTHTTY